MTGVIGAAAFAVLFCTVLAATAMVFKSLLPLFRRSRRTTIPPATVWANHEAGHVSRLR